MYSFSMNSSMSPDSLFDMFGADESTDYNPGAAQRQEKTRVRKTLWLQKQLHSLGKHIKH